MSCETLNNQFVNKRTRERKRGQNDGPANHKGSSLVRPNQEKNNPVCDNDDDNHDEDKVTRVGFPKEG